MWQNRHNNVMFYGVIIAKSTFCGRGDAAHCPMVTKEESPSVPDHPPPRLASKERTRTWGTGSASL